MSQCGVGPLFRTCFECTERRNTTGCGRALPPPLATWVCVVPNSGGMAYLYNFGFFSADTKEKAIAAARKAFNTTGPIEAWPLDECGNGWTYYR